MMKVNMSKMKFKELLEEYTSNLEKDYDSNQKENSGKASYLDHSWPDYIDH
jgi:ribosomal protein S17E